MIAQQADSVRLALAELAIAGHPQSSAVALERSDPAEVGALLDGRPSNAVARVLERMLPEHAARVLPRLGASQISGVVSVLSAPRAAAMLGWLDADEVARVLGLVAEPIARELRELLSYPPNTAGALMDNRVFAARESDTSGAMLQRLRDAPSGLHQVFVVDDEHRLVGAVELYRLALAAPDTPVETLTDRTPGAVSAMATREELVEYLTRTGLPSIAVIDPDRRLLGVLRHAALVSAAEAEAALDVQRMVGVSVDEKALSPVGFAVKKRLPWLHVNLLTAFIAASVVGVFESTIAKVSALAVLLPVVAGQSGNSGAQAMAVTMRGLALRELRGRHWRRLATKEASVGFINGAAISISAGLGVLLWSRSVTLAGVIAISMVIAMSAANFAGASIPIVLQRFG
ncbi:MAG: magnesium transporter, partial [Kofleriaceae bacterium]